MPTAMKSTGGGYFLISGSSRSYQMPMKFGYTLGDSSLFPHFLSSDLSLSHRFACGVKTTTAHASMLNANSLFICNLSI
jgi:hypothetical protein